MKALRIVGRTGPYCTSRNIVAVTAPITTRKATRDPIACRNCGARRSEMGMAYTSDRAAHREGWCRSL